MAISHGIPLRRFWRRVGAILLAIVTATTVTIAGCVQTAATPLRVGTSLWTGFAHLYLAESLGYFQDSPVRFVEYPSGHDMTQAFLNGEIEAAAVTMGDALSMAEKGIDVKVVLVFDSSNGADVILAKPTIENLQALKGKQVGVEASVLGTFTLTRALAKVGLTPEAVQIVPLGISEQEAAFREGNVDALVTYEPVRSRLLASGAKQIFDSSQIPGEIVDILVVRSDALKNQTATVQFLIDQWFRAYAQAKKDPQDAAKRVAPRLELSPEAYQKSLAGIHFPTLEENRKLLSQGDSTLLEGARQLIQVMLDRKLLTQPVDPSVLLDDQFVQNGQSW